MSTNNGVLHINIGFGIIQKQKQGLALSASHVMTFNFKKGVTYFWRREVVIMDRAI